MPMKDYTVILKNPSKYINEFFDLGIKITPDTTYREIATNIDLLHTNKERTDDEIFKLINTLLVPTVLAARSVSWENYKNIEEEEHLRFDNTISLKVIFNKYHLRGFYMYLDEYTEMLDCLFNTKEYTEIYKYIMEQNYYFKESIPRLMEFNLIVLFKKVPANYDLDIFYSLFVKPYTLI